MRIRIILFLTLIGQVFSAYSQDFVWANSVTGESHEHGVKAIKDPLGNTYIIGYSTGHNFEFEGVTYAANGKGDAFFAKLDTNKDLVWMKAIGGDDPIYPDSAVDILIDPFGDIYLSLISKGDDFTYDGQILSGINSPGQQGGEAVLLKVNSDGEYIWHDSGSAGSIFNGLTTDANGNLYMTGKFRREITLGGTITLINPSTGTTVDMLVAKYQPDGTILWAKNAGGMPHNTFAYGFDIEINTQSDEVIVLSKSDGEVFYDGVPTPVTNSEDEGIVLVSYNLDGTQNWLKLILELPSTPAIHGVSLDISTSGIIGVCGYNLEVGLVGFYTSDGTEISEHEYPSTEEIVLNSIVFNQFNDAYLSGYCDTDAILGSSPGTVSLSATTGFIVKVDMFQQVEWVSEFTSTRLESSIFYDGERIMYAGRIDDDFIYNSGQTVITNNSGDALFGELVDKDLLSIDTYSEENITVYPNPTSGLLVIESNTLQKVEIYSISGILLKTIREKEFDLSQYSKGMYLLKLMTSKGITIKKIVLI